LCGYAWPGNVRELENCIHQAVVLHDSETLERHMLPEAVRSLETASVSLPPTEKKKAAVPVRDRIVPFEEIEKQAIEQALRVTQGNVAQAAAGLHLSQATLYRKIRDYGLNLGFIKTNRAD